MFQSMITGGFDGNVLGGNWLKKKKKIYQFRERGTWLERKHVRNKVIEGTRGLYFERNISFHI